MNKRIQDMDVKNKRVLLRCDFNVPVKDGKILDDSKIVAALFTIDYLVKQGAKIIIMYHFGKVKTEEDKEKNSLAIVASHLQKLVSTKVILDKAEKNILGHIKIEMNNDTIGIINIYKREIKKENQTIFFKIKNHQISLMVLAGETRLGFVRK